MLFKIPLKLYFLILFEINIDNNIKGEPNENNLKEKTIISIISSKEIEPPFIKNENIIKPNEKTKKQHKNISIKRIIIWRVLFISGYSLYPILYFSLIFSCLY